MRAHYPFERRFLSLTPEHMVREGVHDGDPAELRHPGDVPTLYGRRVPDKQVQDITGE